MASTDDLTTERSATVDDRMIGFPPAKQSLVTLANWQEEGNLRWAFRHMREIMPTQLIRADRSTTRPLDGASASSTLAAPVARLDGTSATAAEVFASTF